MGFQRREELAGGGITKYADTKLKCCPFCGSNEPHWLTDAYISNYSMIASKCINGYKFQCEKCKGILEIQGNTDFCFQNEAFTSVKLINAGSGHMNVDRINRPLTISELKSLCSDGGVQNQEQPIVIEQPIIEQSSVNQNPTLSTSKKCPKCGVVLAANQKFCANCGTNLSAKKCSKCGVELANGQKFCANCGAQVGVEPTKQQPKSEYASVLMKKDTGPWKVFAKIGFVMGIILFILAFILFNFLSYSFGIISIILSALGTKSVYYSGRAKAGLVFSILAVIIGIILYIVYLVSLSEGLNDFYY